MTVSVLWLFLTVPWVGLQCVIVAFPDHTDHLGVQIRTKVLRLNCLQRLSADGTSKLKGC